MESPPSYSKTIERTLAALSKRRTRQDSWGISVDTEARPVFVGHGADDVGHGIQAQHG